MWCDDSWPDEQIDYEAVNQSKDKVEMRSVYFVSVSVIMYLLPMLIMGVAYIVIIHKLWSSTIPGEIVDSRVQQQARTKKKAIIIIVFMN